MAGPCLLQVLRMKFLIREVKGPGVTDVRTYNCINYYMMMLCLLISNVPVIAKYWEDIGIILFAALILSSVHLSVHFPT